jgi:hypothetical protein
MNKKDFSQLINLINDLEYEVGHNETIEQIWHIIYRNSVKKED